MLKWKVVIRSKYLDLTEVVSTPQMNFKIIKRKMESSNSLQLHTVILKLIYFQINKLFIYIYIYVTNIKIINNKN